MCCKKKYSINATDQIKGFQPAVGDGPQNVPISFSKPISRVEILIGVTSNFLLTVESWIQPGAHFILLNKKFLPPAWKEPVMSIKSPRMGRVNRKAVTIADIVPLFIQWGILFVIARMGIVENLLVDPLVWTFLSTYAYDRSLSKSKNSLMPCKTRGNWYHKDGSQFDKLSLYITQHEFKLVHWHS